ncbi:hypothetical protein J4G33_16495 [Actinotalea sp. BY-33]|uniref:Uncharacterized protein n=1 Tax=Actinotalea soli TaxID=2819234 RepID=A0A939LT52_9CELL|nr:hypothetical protein [Actinotalea soli]MBO1753408.1 hypothetical protein [Actinotalea soli]
MSDQPATNWPSTEAAASAGWTIRSELDPVGSQLSWYHAALAADELELAGRIVRAPVAGTEHEASRRTSLAEALVLVGRPAEARPLLEADGVRPPQPSGPVDWPQVVLGSTYAATGDDGAWAWLTAKLSDVLSPEWRLRLTRVVAAVADHRGDLPVADAAWADVAELGGTSSPRLAQRAALANILRRKREGSPESIIDVVVGAYGTLRGAAVDDAATRNAVMRTAGALNERGDRAGARLLLRVATGMLPRDAAMETALRRSRPEPSRALLVRLAGVGLATSVAVAYVVVRGAASPQTLGAEIRGTTLVLAAVLGLVTRLSSLPGFTMPETRVWRGLRSMRYDPVEARGGTSGISGWLGVAGVLGAVATMVTIAGVLSGATSDGAWPLWATTGGSMVLWLVLTAAGGAGGVLVLRQVRGAVGRRRVARARAEAAARADQLATVCACWDSISTWGADARRYAERHLTIAGPPVPVAVPDSRLRMCPASGLPWLTGPLGQGERFVALKGALRDVDDSPAGRPATQGFYL